MDLLFFFIIFMYYFNEIIVCFQFFLPYQKS